MHEKIPKTMARSKVSRLATLVCAASMSSLIGCDGTGNAPISNELQNKWPIWKAEDLEINRYRGDRVLYDHQMFDKPDFYNGKMPLEFTSSETLGRGHTYGNPIILSHKFKEHTNYFLYDNGVILKGAVAIDNGNTMVAEAEVHYSILDSAQQISMEEFHYSGGLLVYHCNSEIDPSVGTKKKEFNQSGRKQKDYFFILPLGVNN